MNIIPNIIPNIKAIEAPSFLNEEALQIYLDLFNTRINYGKCWVNEEGKREYRTIRHSDWKAGRKDKLPSTLHDNLIKNALLHDSKYQWTVGFHANIKHTHFDENGKLVWHPLCQYALIDIDDTSQYFKNKEIIEKVFKIYGLKINWYASTVKADGTFSGWHGYIFFEEPFAFTTVAGALKGIAIKHNLEVKGGQLEFFPSTKSSNSLGNKHRLPCQEGFGVSLTKFAGDVINNQSSITEELISKLARQGYRKDFTNDSRKKSKVQLEEFVNNLEWTSRGQTRSNLFNTTLYLYKEHTELSLKELVEKTHEIVIKAPGYKQYCDHCHEIKNLIWGHLTNRSKCAKKGWRRVHNKRETKHNDLISKLLLFSDISGINSYADLTAEFNKQEGTNYVRSAIYKVINKEYLFCLCGFIKMHILNIKLFPYLPQYTSYEVIINSILGGIRKQNKTNVHFDNKNNESENIVTTVATKTKSKLSIEERIGKLSLAELKSCYNKNNNINKGTVCELLQCHRNTLKLSKEELCLLICKAITEHSRRASKVSKCIEKDGTQKQKVTTEEVKLENIETEVLDNPDPDNPDNWDIFDLRHLPYSEQGKLNTQPNTDALISTPNCSHDEIVVNKRVRVYLLLPVARG